MISTNLKQITCFFLLSVQVTLKIMCHGEKILAYLIKEMYLLFGFGIIFIKEKL